VAWSLEFIVTDQRKKPSAIGVKAPYPGFVLPALASDIDRVPNGERWIHEVKFDGYRVQVHLRDAPPKRTFGCSLHRNIRSPKNVAAGYFGNRSAFA
jgi:hypothetical protein